jgi:hypothetical protein
MLAHDFMLVKELPSYIGMHTRYYDSIYTIAISDDFVLKSVDEFMSVNAFSNELDNLQKGLNYYGITIYTSEMAKELRQVFLESQDKFELMLNDYNLLMNILNRAIKEHVYLVHIGI